MPGVTNRLVTRHTPGCGPPWQAIRIVNSPAFRFDPLHRISGKEPREGGVGQQAGPAPYQQAEPIRAPVMERHAFASSHVSSVMKPSHDRAPMKYIGHR